MLRKLVSIVKTHSEEFGEIAEVNYDHLFKDVSNINLQF